MRTSKHTCIYKTKLFNQQDVTQRFGAMYVQYVSTSQYKLHANSKQDDEIRCVLARQKEFYFGATWRTCTILVDSFGISTQNRAQTCVFSSLWHLLSCPELNLRTWIMSLAETSLSHDLHSLQYIFSVPSIASSPQC